MVNSACNMQSVRQFKHVDWRIGPHSGTFFCLDVDSTTNRVLLRAARL